MSDTETGTDPEPIFSAEDGLEKLWVQAYQGEVLGEELFERVAAQLDEDGEPEHAAKVRVLARLELRTKEAIAPALARAGISTEPDSEMLSLAAALAAGTRDITWEQLMDSIENVTGQYIPLYARIGELDPTERAAAELLVAHEEALRDFGRAERAGNAATSLYQVNALSHMR